MPNPLFVHPGRTEDASTASPNSNIINRRPPTSSPRAQPQPLAENTQPEPKDLRAAEVFGGSTNPFRRGPYRPMASSSTAAALESPRRQYPENNPFSDQARLRRTQTQMMSSPQTQQGASRLPLPLTRGSSLRHDSDMESSRGQQERLVGQRRPPPPPPSFAPSPYFRQLETTSIAQEARRRPQPNSIQQEARRRPNPGPSPDHRRTKSSFHPLSQPQHQSFRQENLRGYTAPSSGLRVSSTMSKLGEEDSPFWSPEDLTPEAIANQAEFDEWKRRKNILWVGDSLLSDDHFDASKKASRRSYPRGYTSHQRTRGDQFSPPTRHSGSGISHHHQTRNPNENRPQNNKVTGSQNDLSFTNRAVDRITNRQLSSSRSMPMLKADSSASPFIFPAIRPARPSDDTKPKRFGIAASKEAARGAPSVSSENSSHRRIGSMASILSFGRHKDDTERSQKEEKKRLEKAAKEQKEKEEKERKERLKYYTQREVQRAKDIEAARRRRVEDAIEIEERRELERQIAGGQVVLGSREQRDGGYGVEDRERDRIRKKRGGGVAYLGR
ncbi:hypothetical protein BZA77DRAFT_353989 [Pyronema omphalodes]|nr:hypothetical protein BZA77DRAFT_353989 [Pyronema omphalodes]